MARARSGTSDLTRTFADCPQPIYLLNSRRMITYANPACATWLGIEVERLLGARCDYHSLALENQAQTIAAGLCPPPEAFAVPHYSGVVSALHEGQVQERPCHYLALSLPDETSPALLALVGAVDQPRSVASLTAEEPSSAELHVLLRWLRQTLHARPVLDRWVGDLPSVRRAREQFAAAAACRAAVVVVGPQGAGRKELARGIHYRRRTDALAPLVTIDCAVVDAEAMQTSITSLVRKRSSTDVPCGALLLLEVDQLSPAAQRELLGFLTLPGFDVRTLATATRSPLELAGQGGFDRALAFALSTLVIELPPLATRVADLPLLVQMLVEELNAAGGKQLSGVAGDALERLAVYSWPGDVAQLADAIKQAWTSAAGPQITLADLPRWLSAAEDNAARPHRAAQAIVLDDFLADVERELLARALARGRGNKSKAARLLGISRPRLLRRMEQLGLSPSPPEAAAD